MGMYTELIFGVRLKENTPTDVIETLQYMTGLTDYEPEKLLFDLNIYRNPLSGGSYYFGVHSCVTKMWYDDIAKAWSISSRANIKNYNSEIEKFLEWIKPYIDSGSGLRDMYAIVTNEESEEPTLYYLHKKHGDYEDEV